jgi:hypothetical protein
MYGRVDDTVGRIQQHAQASEPSSRRPIRIRVSSIGPVTLTDFSKNSFTKHHFFEGTTSSRYFSTRICALDQYVKELLHDTRHRAPHYMGTGPLLLMLQKHFRTGSHANIYPPVRATVDTPIPKPRVLSWSPWPRRKQRVET